MDITAEITVKFRLAIKSKLRAMKIEEDDDLIDFIMIIFARKKRFEAIKEDLEELLEEKTADFAVWLDLLIQKGLFIFHERITSGFGNLSSKQADRHVNFNFEALNQDRFL